MTQRNRGKQSNDDQYFAPRWHPVFTEAADDLGYLLGRGYAPNSSIQIVGNRYRLNKRQRNALFRIGASAQEIQARQESECSAADLQGQTIEIDGFNLLILLESALSGAYVFQGRDGTYRDISSVHGSYKRVQKTEQAILLVGQILESLGAEAVQWYLDQPVSNSGRLKTMLMEISREHGLNWSVDLVFDPDKVLAKSSNIIVSTDGWILDQVPRWFNLGAFLIRQHLPEANVIVV